MKGLRTVGLAIALITLALPTIADAENSGNGNGNGNSNSNGNGNGNSSGNGNGNGKGNDSSASPVSSSLPADTAATSTPAAAAAPSAPDAAISGPVSLPSQSSSETDALKAVQSGSAVPLDAILGKAEINGAGRVIDAQLITVQGFLLYAIKLLDQNGTVSIHYFYAKSGQPVRAR